MQEEKKKVRVPKLQKKKQPRDTGRKQGRRQTGTHVVQGGAETQQRKKNPIKSASPSGLTANNQKNNDTFDRGGGLSLVVIKTGANEGHGLE